MSKPVNTSPSTQRQPWIRWDGTASRLPLRLPRASLRVAADRANCQGKATAGIPYYSSSPLTIMSGGQMGFRKPDMRPTSHTLFCFKEDIIKSNGLDKYDRMVIQEHFWANHLRAAWTVSFLLPSFSGFNVNNLCMPQIYALGSLTVEWCRNYNARTCSNGRLVHWQMMSSDTPAASPSITISPKTSDFLRLQSYGIPNNKDDTIKANIQKAMVRFFCFISSMINVM